MTGEPGRSRGLERALAAERGFVRSLGGYTVGLAGGTLLVNERIPVPRFNVVQTVQVAPARQAQFFEGALDHYFQRALRPTFRVPDPAPAHVDAALRRLGFVPEPRSESWLLAGSPRPDPGEVPGVRRVRPSELDELVPLWAGTGEALELRRQLEVGWHHPNPGEELVAFVADGPDGSWSSAALVYRRDDCADVEAVITRPADRGRGRATALVQGLLSDGLLTSSPWVALRTAEPRLAQRLAPFGFAEVASHRVYALDPNARLEPVTTAAPSAPLWRPRPPPGPGPTSPGA